MTQEESAWEAQCLLPASHPWPDSPSIDSSGHMWLVSNRYIWSGLVWSDAKIQLAPQSQTASKMPGSMTSRETVCQIHLSLPLLCFASLWTKALTWPGKNISSRLFWNFDPRFAAFSTGSFNKPALMLIVASVKIISHFVWNRLKRCQSNYITDNQATLLCLTNILFICI